MLFMTAGSLSFLQNVVGELYDRANLPIKECLVEQWRALPAARTLAWFRGRRLSFRAKDATRIASSLKVPLITLASSHSRRPRLAE
jgi:hypothetical protein